MEAAAAHVAPAPGVEPVASHEWLAYAPLAGSASFDSGDAESRDLLGDGGYAPAVKSNAIGVGTAVDPAARESAFESFGECGELATGGVKTTPVDSDLGGGVRRVWRRDRRGGLANDAATTPPSTVHDRQGNDRGQARRLGNGRADGQRGADRAELIPPHG